MDAELQAGRHGLERFREYLCLLARLQLDRQIQHKVDPSDVVQETLMTAHGAIAQFKGHGKEQLAAWLRTILASRLADAVRYWHRAKRDVARERCLQLAVEDSSDRVEAWVASDTSSPSAKLSRQERLFELAGALARLPDDQRTAVEMHYFKGARLAEVAGQMGRTSASVAGLIRRGLTRLREQLDQSS